MIAPQNSTSWREYKTLLKILAKTITPHVGNACCPIAYIPSATMLGPRYCGSYPSSPEGSYGKCPAFCCISGEGLCYNFHRCCRWSLWDWNFTVFARLWLWQIKPSSSIYVIISSVQQYQYMFILNFWCWVFPPNFNISDFSMDHEQGGPPKSSILICDDSSGFRIS